ncbi:hypothetical protein LTR84_001859 [Exophiala bonariae]|uniref:Chlorophyll synthesis pathway protein BchC n=1 Tax=Exophiala bonariae TaxID=1690606 RepID=A0AAV9NBX8_9EURO|nr:hypothetical protein LTR84_001859 [Exophiala bonariae]
MRAARYYGKRDIRVEDVPIPEPGSNQCLIEIAWCGICGSDLHEYVAGPMGCPVPERPHPLTGGHIPVTLGHEFCGRIKSAPSGSKFKVGQAVMADPRVLCSKCHSCSTGNGHTCDALGFNGISGGTAGGGLSEFAAIDEDMLYALPESVDLDFAALIEPLTVAWHAIKTINAKIEGLDALIIGGGPVGYALACTLRAENVKSILVSEPTLKRREQAKAVVDKVIDPRSENVGDVCRSTTGGKGVDLVFDCAGIQVGLEAAFDAIVRGGYFVNVAVWEVPMSIPFYQFFLKEIKIFSSCCYNKQDFEDVVRLIGQGKFPGYQNMVTDRISVEDIVSKGFEELVNNKDDHIKILVSPK